MGITGIYMVHTARRIKRTNGNSDLLRRTIKAVVWFPIAPIVSTWFNGILPIVRYYTGRQYQELEFINIALFALMAVIHALAMIMNPCRLERHRPK
ncbi:hypothetical protein DL89DRAFT_265382 [Linderina pennispora]|uniref:Uncharacterized protein n=1 Tax=Linderina pennispora TaxID=61395 RepID=A0A1Y1WI52_9FUNG|nr:uncharacterized protein DL89DRAFT_265382 [Linderina pennispora]ORX73250.1 hypothetical protein DL89DRAFT_265382 [Linderina pennispora]